MQNLIEIRNLKVDIMSTRGLIHAVRGVSLEIGKSSIHGLVGESGCGKSVTAKSILRLHNSRYVRIGGQILFEDKDLVGMPQKDIENIRGRDISMIFQDPMTALNPLFTIGEQIAEVYKRHFNYDKEKAKKSTLELLKRVGIAPAETRYNQYPFEFSGGMLQRVVIAIAIAAKPKLLIADEPTTALDVTIQAQILQLLKELQRELNISILIITHNFGIVHEICDTVSVMYAGKILETASKREIFENTINPYSKALIKSIPRKGMRESKLLTIPGIPPELFDLVDGCPFEPRCSFRTEICQQQMAELIQRKSNDGTLHCAACHNH